MKDKETPESVLPKMIYTVPEVAKILMVTQDCVRKLVQKGHLIGLQLGRLKITHKELERFLDEYNGMNFSDFDNVTPLEVLNTKITH